MTDHLENFHVHVSAAPFLNFSDLAHEPDGDLLRHLVGHAQLERKECVSTQGIATYRPYSVVISASEMPEHLDVAGAEDGHQVERRDDAGDRAQQAEQGRAADTATKGMNRLRLVWRPAFFRNIASSTSSRG